MESHFFCFPHPDTADATGLVAVTEEMTPALLLSAYSQGLFPWTSDPVGWYSPNPRAVFIPAHVHLPRNLPKLFRRGQFRVTCDTAFTQVMQACAAVHADEGIWITEPFIASYSALHAQGFAHSVEVWQGTALVGGIYGVHIGGLFAGESMFHTVANASKIAFAVLLAQLDALGVSLIDAQVINPHTEALGACLVERDVYLRALKHVICQRPRHPAGGNATRSFSGSRWAAEPLSMGGLRPR